MRKIRRRGEGPRHRVVGEVGGGGGGGIGGGTKSVVGEVGVGEVGGEGGAVGAVGAVGGGGGAFGGGIESVDGGEDGGVDGGEVGGLVKNCQPTYFMSTRDKTMRLRHLLLAFIMIITPPAFGQTQADFLHAIGTVESGHDDNAGPVGPGSPLNPSPLTPWRP